MFTRLLFWFFQRPTVEAPEPIITQNTSNDAVPHKDAFSELEHKKITLKPHYSRKTAIFGPDFGGT